jgi:hypothetical protein
MHNIVERIEEIKALETKFIRAAPPQPEDLRKLCSTLIDVLRWIEQHDERPRLRPLGASPSV